MKPKKPIDKIQDDIRSLVLEVEGEAKEMKRKTKLMQKKPFRKFSFKDKLKLKYKAETSYIITMKFANGIEKTWVISTKKNTFKVGGKMYYLDYQEAYYDLSLNQYHLYYHSEHSPPIQREVQPVGNSVFFNVRPENLQALIKFEYVKTLAMTQSIGTILKVLMVLAFVNTLGMAGLIFMLVK